MSGGHFIQDDVSYRRSDILNKACNYLLCVY